MHVARWVLVTLVSVSIVLAAVSVHVRRSEGGAVPPPSSGRLLDPDSSLAGAPRTIGIMTGTHLDNVVDVTTAGDSAFVLAPRGWRIVVGRRVRGPFGLQPAGAPDAIERGHRIRVTDDGVYVLDTSRRDVSRWTRDGRLLERFPIGPPTRPLVPQDLAVDQSGQPVVIAQEVRAARTRWVVLRLSVADSAVALLRARAGASLFTQPRIATTTEDIVLADPTTHALHWIGAGTRRLRTDAPLWTTPDSLRARYTERMGRIGVVIGASLALPDTLPSLQALAVLRDGRIITGTNPMHDDLFVEAFTARGEPLGRTSAGPLRAPVFLTSDGIVLVTDEPNRIVLTMHPLGS